MKIFSVRDNIMKKFIIVVCTAGILLTFFLFNHSQFSFSNTNSVSLADRISQSSVSALYGDTSIFESSTRQANNGNQALSKYLDELLNTITMSATQSDTSVILNISYLDYDDFLSIILQSSASLRQDIINFLALDVTTDEIKNYLYTYLASFLTDYKSYTMKKVTNTLEYAIDTVRIPSDEFITDYLNNFSDNLTNDLIEKLPKSQIKENTASDSSSFINNCEIGKSTVLYINSADKTRYKAILKVNEVLYGREALDKLKELNPANNDILLSSNELLVYVSYDVTNLSEAEVIVPDYFTYLDDNLVRYKTFGRSVLGLLKSSKLAGRKSKTFSTVLVTPQNIDTIYWYDTISGETRAFAINKK